MLVLSRKPGESINIGDEILLRVLDVKGNRVRLGVMAPDNIHVVRHELVVDIADDKNSPAEPPRQGT